MGLEIGIGWLSLLLFGSLGVLLALGLPMAFCTGSLAIIFLYVFGSGSVLNMLPSRVFPFMTDYQLSAVPLFIFMAAVLEKAGIIEELFDVIYKWLGSVKGGLASATVVACTILAAMVGVVGATEVTMGMIALPAMLRRGYEPKLACGALLAGGTLGILIPPSVNMIVYGSLTNNSIGKLFIAGIIPGILLTGSFMLFIYLSNVLGGKPIREPVVPLSERIRTLSFLVPPLIVFGIVMGSLYFGIATATESAALGVIAALFFVWQSGKMTWEVMRTCFISTARVSGMILLIITAAFILNLTISLTGVADAMTKWVASLGLSATALILALIVFYLILGMFMDVLSMQVATIPITYPIVTALGVDPIWYGIFIVLMCELGLITPPVGMNLFVVHGIRPDKGGIEDAIWGALPYAVIMILFTLLLMAMPSLVTWLPAHM